MTLDDAASTLNVTEGHLKDLIRDGYIRSKYRWVGKGYVYNVNGADVRKRKRQIDFRTVKRITRARPHGRKGR